MSAVFLDSSYVIALLSRRDANHNQAIQLRPDFVGSLITTEYVLIELLDSLSDRTVRRVAAEAARGVRRRADVQVVPASDELAALGVDLFERRPDKDWGLTDCISFVVMEREGITEALTTDHHFEQAGFKALLGSGG